MPSLCHLPQYAYGIRNPTARVLGLASYPGLGTWDLYSYRWHSMVTHILYLYHVTVGLHYIMCRFSTGIFHRLVSDVATDFPSGVWCRGLTTGLLYVCPLFGNLVWNDSGFVSMTWWKTTFSLYLIMVFTCISMPQNMILYFHLPYLHVSNCALFLLFFVFNTENRMAGVFYFRVVYILMLFQWLWRISAAWHC